MAINANLFRRPSDRGLFLTAAIVFPLFVLIGYFKSYYFSSFFDARPIANSLVHLHGIVMSVWVIYFVAQVALVRSKNIKLHMTMGLLGIALAAVVVIVGLMTGYDSQIVRGVAPPGWHPHTFFLIPVGDMLLFVVYFAGAIYYRKKPAEHKSLMLLSAIIFMPAAFSRLPIFSPENSINGAFGLAMLIGLIFLVWHSLKHKKLNMVFALGLVLFMVSLPLRIMIGESGLWLSLAARLAS